MNNSNFYTIQNRWKLVNDKLVYFGLRNKENLFNTSVKINARQKAIIQQLPKELSNEERNIISTLISEGIIVTFDHLNVIPTQLRHARFCTNCAANDYIIPGIEFDENGLCPICQTKDIVSNFKAVTPVMNTFPRSKSSRFDVAVFYTGGKDSTYLLYYLSKVCQLRVLACTWEIPFMSESAKKSIEGAKKHLETVEFISRYVNERDMRKMYQKLYDLADNTCACPSLAYVLFYPELVANKVPYFVIGNEPAQIIGLYYNHIAPAFAYRFANQKALNLLINVGRVLTLHPPLKSGQFQTLQTMKQLAYGDNIFKRLSGYSSDLVTNVIESMKEIEHLTKPFKKAIRQSSWSGNIPRFVQVDFNEISGGTYDWRTIKNIIIQECGWVEPSISLKGLHTSCMIERCKEYSQYKRFREMKSTLIPFSALEISIASSDKCLTKEEAIAEIESALGFSIEKIPECAIMEAFIQPK